MFARSDDENERKLFSRYNLSRAGSLHASEASYPRCVSTSLFFFPDETRPRRSVWALTTCRRDGHRGFTRLPSPLDRVFLQAPDTARPHQGSCSFSFGLAASASSRRLLEHLVVQKYLRYYNLLSINYSKISASSSSDLLWRRLYGDRHEIRP